MVKKMFRLGMLAAALAFSVTVVGCDDASPANAPVNQPGGGPQADFVANNDAGPFADSWEGSLLGEDRIITIAYYGWALLVPSRGFGDYGVFHRTGNSAVLFDRNNVNVGTVSVTGPNTVNVEFNHHSSMQGSFQANRAAAPPPVTVLNVAVHSAYADVALGETLDFTAAVVGVGNPPQGVH